MAGKSFSINWTFVSKFLKRIRLRKHNVSFEYAIDEYIDRVHDLL
jgi:hypothetical protein